jgi:hypothetical protein
VDVLNVKGVTWAWKEHSKNKESFAARFAPDDISVRRKTREARKENVTQKQAMTPRVKTMHVLPFEEGTAL